MASSVPGFDHDVFVSYATVDNRPPADPWVEEFVEYLRAALAAEVGRFEDQVWWDKSHIDEEDLLSDQISSRVASAACMVVVLSKGYARSSWCRREREAFGTRITNGKGFDRRVFLVDIGNLPLEDRPSEFEGINGRYFYVQPSGTERQSDRATVGRTKADREKSTAFFDKIEDLARSIAVRLEELRKPNEATRDSQGLLESYLPTSLRAVEPMHPGITVFLADPADTLVDEHEQMLRFLSDYFYVVPKSGPRHFTFDEWQADMHGALAEAALAIQLLDGLPGRRIDSHPENLKLVTAQAQLINAENKTAVCWRPSDASSSKDSLLQELLDHSEFVGMNQFQAFKDKVLGLAMPTTEKRVESVIDGIGLPPRVFIQCDMQDRSEAEEFRDSLLGLPCLPILSDSDADPATIRSKTTEFVRSCDAVVLFWGKKAKDWVTKQLWNMLDDINGREHPLLSLAVCKAPPLAGVHSQFGFPHDLLTWPDEQESKCIKHKDWVAKLGGAK